MTIYDQGRGRVEWRGGGSAPKNKLVIRPSLWKAPNSHLLGVLYPAVTLVAITVTANHYIMDAIGGGLLIAASFAVMELVNRRRRFLPKALKGLRLPLQSRLQRRRISEEQERAEDQGHVWAGGENSE